MKRNSTELKVKYHKGDKPSKKFNNKNPRPGNMGQWANPGVPTEIPSGNITMQGVPYPVKGIDNFGNEQIMMPGADYVFPGSVVTEIPMAKSGGWLDKYQGTTGGSETGKRPAKYKVTASDIEASDINEQSQNYYNPDDFYYSDLEYDKDKDSIAERVNLCKTTGKGCLSTANYWYNKWVAPKIGNPSSWDELTHSGVNSTEENTYDSWDVHGLDNRVVLYDRNSYYTGERQPGHGKGKIREAEGIWKELDLPIGAIVGYGEHGVNFQKPGEVSLNKQKGLPESGHSGRVVAFDKDTGEPWVFDSVNGLSRISENGYQPISVISVDNRILGNTYSNMQKGKNAYTTANTTPIEIQWDDFIDEDGDVVSFDEDEFNPFMQSFINNKPKWQGILGLDDKTYNEYARIAGALAISETEGGNDNTWRYGLPSYTLDKMGLTNSTGITQLNNDVVRNLYQKHQDKFHRYGLFMSAEGRKQSGRTGGRLYNFSNPAPQDAAFVTMLLLKDNKENAERLFKKGKTNNPNLTEADKQWYTWNQQQTLLKGEAQGDAIMLKKFRDAYNKIRVTEGKQPKLAEKKTGGSKLPSHLPEAYRTGGWLDQYQDGSELLDKKELAVVQPDTSIIQPDQSAKTYPSNAGDVPHDYVQNAEGDVSSVRPGTSPHPKGITNMPDNACGPGFMIDYDQSGNPVCKPVPQPSTGDPISQVAAPRTAAPTYNTYNYYSSPAPSYDYGYTPRFSFPIEQPLISNEYFYGEYPSDQEDFGDEEGAKTNQAKLARLKRRQDRQTLRQQNKQQRIKERQQRPNIFERIGDIKTPRLGIGRFFKNIGKGIKDICTPGESCPSFEQGGWLENYGDLPVFQTDGEFVYNGKTYKRKVNQNNQVEYYFVQPGKSVMSPSEEVPIAPVQARELDSFYNSPARAMQEKGEMLGQGLKKNVQRFREKEQATKKTSMRQQAIDAANAQFAGTDATNVVQAVTPEEQQQVDAAQAERDRIERTGTIKAWDPLEEQKKMFGLRMGMPTAEAAYVGTTGTAPALWAPAAGGVYAAGAQGIVPALNWFNNTLVGQGLNVYLGAESAVNLPTHAKEFYDRPSLATGTQLLWDPIMMKFGYEGAKGLVGRGRNVYNALDAKWNKFMWGDESINVPASLPGSSNSGSSAGVISEAYQPGSTLRNTRMVGNEGYTEDIPQWKLDRMRLREEYERIQALAEPIEDAASGNWYRESVRSNLLERLSLAERPSKQKVLRAIKTDNLPNSNLKMIRSFRGNLETPKKIKIIGSSGDLSVNPVGDNTWTLSTRMTNPVEAGKAMNWLNKTFTRPNPSIVENNSLSLDSYKGWLNTATKSKDWTGTFSNYISLNNQHQHSNLFKGLDVSGNEAIIFNNMDDAAEAAKRVNSKLLEPKGISEKAFAVQKSNGQWGLLIPNYKLTRNWAKGGAFELTLSKNDNFTKSNKNWLDMYE